MFRSKFLLLIYLWAFFSCASPKPVSIKKVESFSLTNMSPSNANVRVNLRINNPNNFNIKLKEYNLEAILNNQSLGKVDIDDVVVLEANTEKAYSLNMKPDVKAIIKMIPKLMFTDSATLNLKGDITAKVFLFSRNFPIDFNHKVAVKDLKKSNLF